MEVASVEEASGVVTVEEKMGVNADQEKMAAARATKVEVVVPAEAAEMTVAETEGHLAE